MNNNTKTTTQLLSKTKTSQITSLIPTTSQLPTITLTTTYYPTSSDISTIPTLPTFNNNSIETIDIIGQIQKQALASEFFIPLFGLLGTLLPCLFLCLCYARC